MAWNPKVVALVVEDRPDSLEIRRRLLEASGFLVLAASNVQEALRYLRGDNYAIDIVITDINLESSRAQDRSGVQLAREIRKATSTIPIVGYSAAFSEGDLLKVEWQAFDRYLPKGAYQPDEILKHVIDWIGLAREYRRRRADFGPRLTEPLLLYSTSTWLAYQISERFFGGEHYVWCTTDFAAGSRPKHEVTIPPSSCPKDIYQALLQDVERGDRHSPRIEQNKHGILKGTSIRKQAGELTAERAAEIAKIVDLAEIREFRPLLYVMPFSGVAHILLDVPVEERAHPLAREFIIERLPRRCFEVVELY